MTPRVTFLHPWFKWWRKSTELSLVQRKFTPTSRATTTFSKVTVWCTVLSSQIIGPFFFEGDGGERVTVTAACYVRMMENLHLENWGSIWFQQDWATAHTTKISMALLHETFPGHLISRLGDVPWPACSPDLSAPDFFSWDYLKSHVYNTLPCTTEELKKHIADEIAGINEDLLREVMCNFSRRLEECI